MEEDKNKKITRFQIFLLVVTILYLIIFGFLFHKRGNEEFLLYIGVIIFFVIFISYLHLKYRFTNLILLGMSIWGFLHMSGGYFIVGDKVLYGYWIFPFLKFDMFVHAFGFSFATLLSYHILKKDLKKKINFKIGVFLVIIGMGLGSLNEIVEFLAVVLFPSTGVGGYENTMFDMVFNTIGSTIAVIYIFLKESKSN